MSHFFKMVLASVIVCFIGASPATNAAQDSKFAEYSKKQKEKYKKFKTDYLDRYEKYRTEIKEKWGVAELSSKTEYVHYNEENKTKVLTDFEHDTIEVSILESDDLSDQEVDKIIRKAIIDSLDKKPEIIAHSQIEFDTVDDTKEPALLPIDSFNKQTKVIVNSQVALNTVDDTKELALLPIDSFDKQTKVIVNNQVALNTVDDTKEPALVPIDSFDKQTKVIVNNQVALNTVDDTKEPAFVPIDSLDKQTKVIANNQIALNTANNKKELSTLTIESPAQTVLKHLGIGSPEKLTVLLKSVELVPTKQQEKIVVKRTEARLTKQIANLENFTSNTDVAPEQIRVSKALIVSLKKEKKVVAYDASELIKKNIKTYKISLRRDRYKKAEQYLKMVSNNAQKWALSDEFILAIMETESHFNPLAKSYVPAYGLMQIVPSTAGADVNTKLLGIKNKPSPDLLFSGRDNIKYGSAYIHILMTRYLKEIKNPTSRLYCAIASYNTGIGNLARAFNNGKKGRLKAMKVINTLSPDEVYDIIKKRTHTETQRYLDKVLESKQYFTQQKA
ncbi:MAG: membrane-bound lytic murein transglycosylase C [Colwellia sp.]|jgi:membrane-bound lytic murein transglycosylase C